MITERLKGLTYLHHLSIIDTFTKYAGYLQGVLGNTCFLTLRTDLLALIGRPDVLQTPKIMYNIQSGCIVMILFSLEFGHRNPVQKIVFLWVNRNYPIQH